MEILSLLQSFGLNVIPILIVGALVYFFRKIFFDKFISSKILDDKKYIGLGGKELKKLITICLVLIISFSISLPWSFINGFSVPIYFQNALSCWAFSSTLYGIFKRFIGGNNEKNN